MCERKEEREGERERGGMEGRRGGVFYFSNRGCLLNFYYVLVFYRCYFLNF